MPNILFATSRQIRPHAAGAVPDFGDTSLPEAPDALICAAATVTGIDIARPDAGTIAAMSEPARGGFAAADLAPILASPNDILVFVHGCANSFTNAITRAAYNQAWLGQAWGAAHDMIGFTWPARPYVIADIIDDYIDYRHDQAQARDSAFHFGLFVRQMQALRARIGGRRLNLLCHSMGNTMLAGAVEALFAGREPPATPIFDQVVLAAADEIATSFATPHGGRLAKLHRLSRAITVYYSRDDIAMALSRLVNLDPRLGHAGPPGETDTRVFPPDIYGFVDCSGVNDYLSDVRAEPDRSHQYYRQSPTVRADIVATLAGMAWKQPDRALFPRLAVA